MSKTKIKQAIQNGLVFLTKQQQSDGCFLSYSSPLMENYTHAIEFRTIFSTTVILQSLTRVSASPAPAIREKAATFLLKQKSEYWSWNYWARDAKEYTSLPYPDDLDDTFCALSALYLHHKKIIQGDVLAHAMQMLAALEVREGGPYYTWLIRDKKAGKIWRDVDLIVNANIAYFLSLHDVRLPHLDQLFKQALKKKRYISPYYPKPFAFFYFLSRFLQDNKQKEVLIRAVKTSAPQSALDVSLSLCTLLQLGYKGLELDAYVKKILQQQEKNGGWKASAFYTGVNPKRDKKLYAGSAALSTAICVEALSLYSKTQQPRKEKKDQNLSIHKAVVQYTEARIQTLPPHIRKVTQQYLHQMIQADKERQIALLPFYTQQALGKLGKRVPAAMIAKLGAANLYGWIAYTIYDNFLDEEGDPHALPVANFCLRELTLIFSSISSKKNAFQKLFQSIMDTQEEANIWEVTHCRIPKNSTIKTKFPNFGNFHYLADRSFGHALGPIALFLTLGIDSDSNDVKNLFAFFHNFLISKQLGDDAHDWEHDLKRGQINSVGAMLLKVKTKNLEQYFWHHTAEQVCKLIEKHNALALEALNKIHIFEHNEIFIRMIEKHQKMVEKTREEREKALLFLKRYTKKS